MDSKHSAKAAAIGERFISIIQVTQGVQEQGTVVGAVINSPGGRRVVAQLLGNAYIDDWRLMYVNKEAIDQAAEALIAQGELVGEEIGGLLDSVGMRKPTDADPYPPDLPVVPERERIAVVGERETA